MEVGDDLYYFFTIACESTVTLKKQNKKKGVRLPRFREQLRKECITIQSGGSCNSSVPAQCL